MLQKEKGFQTEDPPPFDYLVEHLVSQMNYIQQVVEHEDNPVIFLTGSKNFRNEVATTKKYKDRDSAKPFHYKNVKAIIENRWETVVKEGLEADDLLGIFMNEDPDNRICISRDKDLLQLSGWHYQWENNLQPSFGPLKVEGYGEIWLDENKKLRGYGLKFFLSQCIMGDTVDTIPGLPRKGDVAAFNTLEGTKTYEEGLSAVQSLYRATKGIDDPDAYLLEQGRLLWMVRELDEEGNPVMWDF